MSPLSDAWVTTFEAARILQCRPAYVRRLSQLTLLTPHKLMGRLFFYLPQVLHYAQTHPRLGQQQRAS
jgi:hypothetical protein